MSLRFMAICFLNFLSRDLVSVYFWKCHIVFARSKASKYQWGWQRVLKIASCLAQFPYWSPIPIIIEPYDDGTTKIPRMWCITSIIVGQPLLFGNGMNNEIHSLPPTPKSDHYCPFLFRLSYSFRPTPVRGTDSVCPFLGTFECAQRIINMQGCGFMLSSPVLYVPYV